MGQPAQQRELRETFANGWSNPYRYDGRDGVRYGVRYDAASGLYWLSVRAYDPTLGRFLSRDPLGRVPLFLADNPYVYAGNNPLSNVDPSGQRALGASSSQVKQAAAKQQASQARVRTQGGGGANRYRLQVVSGLTDLAYWLGVASLAAFFTGDALAIYFDIKADKLINVLVDLADLAGQAVELLHLLGVKFGQGFTNLADRLRPLVEAISTATSTLRGLLQLPFVGALIQGVLNGIVNYLLPGLEGPFGIAMSLAEVSLGGRSPISFEQVDMPWPTYKRKWNIRRVVTWRYQLPNFADRTEAARSSRVRHAARQHDGLAIACGSRSPPNHREMGGIRGSYCCTRVGDYRYAGAFAEPPHRPVAAS